MEKFVINGGKPLMGEVTISGAKNAAVAILPATLLAADKCVVENIPAIHDVSVSLEILEALGAKIRTLSKNSYEIDTTHLASNRVPDDLSRQMRASYYFLGALLGRCGSGQVAMPGGCNLGPRPIDQHLKAFCALNAADSVEYGMIKVQSDDLRGAHIFFDTVSVGATMNAMLSAVLARGTTQLENVAKEPHVVDLANFLNMMGADVRGAGTDVIKIRGVEKLHGCTYSIIPDQIEAGSFMVAAAATGGNVLIKNVTPKHLEPITAKMRAAGCEIEEFDDSLRIRCNQRLKPLENGGPVVVNEVKIGLHQLHVYGQPPLHFLHLAQDCDRGDEGAAVRSDPDQPIPDILGIQQCSRILRQVKAHNCVRPASVKAYRTDRPAGAVLVREELAGVHHRSAAQCVEHAVETSLRAVAEIVVEEGRLLLPDQLRHVDCRIHVDQRIVRSFLGDSVVLSQMHEPE